MLRSWLLAVALVCAATACPGGTDPLPGEQDAGVAIDAGAGSSVEAQCVRLQEAAEARALSCMGAPAGTLLLFGDDNARLCEAAARGAAAGRVQFDEAKIEACLQAIPGEACDALGGSADCAAFSTAQVALGSECFADAECKDGGFCSLPAAACAGGTCAARAAVGEPCADKPCVATAGCVSVGGVKTCLKRAATGEACGSTASATCDSAKDFCDVTASKCAARRALDGACAASSQCQTGLWCDGSKCLQPSKLGESCDADHACAYATVCDGGKCALWGKVGESCGLLSGGIKACLEGNCVIPSGATVGVCEPFYAVGQDCKKTAECVPGAACDTPTGKCVACSY